VVRVGEELKSLFILQTEVDVLQMCPKMANSRDVMKHKRDYTDTNL
jgi:hypothetical protein